MQSSDQDYEISILDILVVLAENLRLIILVPLVIGLIALGVSYLIPPTYQSTSWLALGEGVVTGMTSQEVMQKVLEKTDWIKVPNREGALKKLSMKLQITFNKKDNCLSITSEAATPQKAFDLNGLVINEYKKYSLPRGNALDSINQNIRTTSEAIDYIQNALKKIGPNIDKVTPGTEGDNVVRAYTALVTNLTTQKASLFALQQSLKQFSSEVIIQAPTLPEKPIKPKKAKIAIMAALASGFLTILYVFIRAAFRNLKGDSESSEKLARIRRGIGLK